MKKRVTVILVVAALAFAGLAINAYQSAGRDRDRAETTCEFGQITDPTVDCDVSIAWSAPALFAGLTAVAVIGVWLLNRSRSAEPQSAENLVG